MPEHQSEVSEFHEYPPLRRTGDTESFDDCHESGKPSPKGVTLGSPEAIKDFRNFILGTQTGDEWYRREKCQVENDIKGGEYRGEIGEGCIGFVRLFEYKKINQRVVIKYFTIRPKFDYSCMEEGLHHLMSLKHSRIVKIFDSIIPNEECKKARIMSEYMSNGSLDQVISQMRNGDDTVNHTDLVKGIVGVVIGMRYLHSHNIVHGTLKPRNLLFDEHDLLRISDLGNKVMFESGIEIKRNNFATPYTAPEMIMSRGEILTKKVDVFAFGVILSEIMNSGELFPREISQRQIARLHREGHRAEIPSTIHPIIKNLIERCWSQYAEDRPEFSEIYDILKDNCFPLYRDIEVESVHKFISEMST
jgi:serine/threonine protein kinase